MGYLGLALTALATEWPGGGHALNIWADLNIDISSRLSLQVGFELKVGDPKQVGRRFFTWLCSSDRQTGLYSGHCPVSQGTSPTQESQRDLNWY